MSRSRGDFIPLKICKLVLIFNLFQDVITSGSSVLETAEVLKKEGLLVNDVVLFLDRQQGGYENLENNDIKVHKVIDVTNLLGILLKHGRIGRDQVDKVLAFMKSTRATLKGVPILLGFRLIHNCSSLCFRTGNGGFTNVPQREDREMHRQDCQEAV